MENILPSEICWRKDKIGYEVPFSLVNGMELKNYLIEQLAP
jgi:hypothetical protein